MGKMSIIIVLTFILVAGTTFIGINEINRRNSEIIAENAEFAEADFSASDVIDYTIEQYIKTGNKNDDITSKWGNATVTSSITDLNIPDSPYDSLLITGVAEVGETSREIKARVTLRQGILPANNPLHVIATSCNLDMKKGRISGYDENMDTSPGSADKTWGVTSSESDIVDALMEEYDTLEYLGKNPIIGKEDDDWKNHTESIADDEPSIAYTPGKIDLQAFIDDYKNYSDFNLTGGQIGNSDGTKKVYGAEDDFKIVYADQTSELIGDVEGYGILAIEGGLSTTDTNTLDWNGLVVCTDSTGTNNTSVYLADSTSVHGSLVAGGLSTNNATVNAQGKVDFSIIDDVVIPSEDFKITITILGSELTAGPSYPDVDTHCRLNVGGSEINYWTGAEDCDEGSPIIWSSTATYTANSEVEIVGIFTNDPYYNNEERIVTSTSNSDKLIVKRDGDPVPEMSGSSGQVDVETWLGSYIDDDNNCITLGQNQAIYLYDYNHLDVSSFEFPEWNDYYNWWQSHGYHLESNTFDEVNYWWYTYSVPTDDQSYEYWNYVNYDLGINRRDDFVDNNTDILMEIYDDRDFQDLAVLLTLHPADTVDRPVELKYSKEALDKVRAMLQFKIPYLSSDTIITDIDWDFKNPDL
jgi:hypothetical protein